MSNCGLGLTQPTTWSSFKHEIILAQQLAFVCAHSGDPLHVLATCDEELIIRLIANTEYILYNRTS